MTIEKFQCCVCRTNHESALSASSCCYPISVIKVWMCELCDVSYNSRPEAQACEKVSI